jgi:predicted DNA-binding ribbon-helix-helix protein
MSETKSKGASARNGRSTLVSRNVTIGTHRTSVRLEPEMWNALRDIVRRERLSMHLICTEIDRRKVEGSSLTAAIRVFVMAYFQVAATEEGHARARHGSGRPFLGTPFAEEADEDAQPLREVGARGAERLRRVEQALSRGAD